MPVSSTRVILPKESLPNDLKKIYTGPTGKVKDETIAVPKIEGGKVQIESNPVGVIPQEQAEELKKMIADAEKTSTA